MLKFKVNDKYSFETKGRENNPLDISKIDESRFHILKDNKSYAVEVLSRDMNTMHFSLKINGHEYQVKGQSELDQLLEKMGMDLGAASKVNELAAPMPGAVISVDVTEGQTVTKGDPLLILEAMKMENVLKSPTDGLIKEVRAVKGTNVDKNDILIVFE